MVVLLGKYGYVLHREETALKKEKEKQNFIQLPTTLHPSRERVLMSACKDSSGAPVPFNLRHRQRNVKVQFGKYARVKNIKLVQMKFLGEQQSLGDTAIHFLFLIVHYNILCACILFDYMKIIFIKWRPNYSGL